MCERGDLVHELCTTSPGINFAIASLRTNAAYAYHFVATHFLLRAATGNIGLGSQIFAVLAGTFPGRSLSSRFVVTV
jgi:hypothetical protein